MWMFQTWPLSTLEAMFFCLSERNRLGTALHRRLRTPEPSHVLTISPSGTDRTRSGRTGQTGHTSTLTLGPTPENPPEKSDKSRPVDLG